MTTPSPRASSLRSSMGASGAGPTKSREEARQDVFDYVEMFYNPVRKQVRNGMLAPVEFERQQILRTEGV